MATVDLPGSAFRGRQSVAFDNLIKLPLGQFSYGAVQLAPALTAARARQVGPNAWAATVTGTYSLAGFDRAPRSFEATYTLVQRPGGWRIADDTDGATALQMWDLPGLRGPARQVRHRDRQRPRGADAGVQHDCGLGRSPGQWCVGDGLELSRGHRDAVHDRGVRQAAVAFRRRGARSGGCDHPGGDRPGPAGSGDRVVINPKAFTALQPIGRRVVITHELTHVAARSSTTRPVPIWLSEGMADYVGYSGLDLPRERVASELLTLVRAGKGPKALPTEADFDPSRTKIAPSYSGSWLAVSRLVDLYGQAKVVAFYRAVASAKTAGGAAQPDPDATAALAFPAASG